MKRHYKLILIFVFLFGTAQLLFTQCYITPPTEKNFADTICIELYKKWVIIPANINGKTHRFIFDTGMSTSMISQDLLPEGSKILRRDYVTDTNQQKQELVYTELCGLSIGKLHFPCFAVLPFSFEGTPFGCAQIDGFIGGDLLQKLIVKIDVQKKQLILTDRKKWFKAEKGASSSMKIKKNVPYINLQIGKVKEIDVMFDSGDNGFYNICEGIFNRMKAFKQEQWKGEIIETTQGALTFGLFGFSNNYSVSLLKLPEWELNGISFKNVYTKTTRSAYSHIGSELFTYGQVILDYPKKQFTFLPYNNVDTITVANERRNNFGIENGHIVISLIWESSELYRQGARRGDWVKELNGKEINDNICLMQETLEGGLIQMKVIDPEGNEKEFHLSPDSF